MNEPLYKPYPGVPEDKWPAMERCVKQIMADPKFKPRKGQNKKSSAIAVCHASIVGKGVINILSNKEFDVGKGGEENMAKIQKDKEVKVEDLEVKKQDPADEVKPEEVVAEEAKEEVAVDESPKEEVVAEEKPVEEVKEEVVEEKPAEEEVKAEPEAVVAEEPSEEKPAEEAPVEVKVEGEKVVNPSDEALTKILDKVEKLEELLMKQSDEDKGPKEGDACKLSNGAKGTFQKDKSGKLVCIPEKAAKIDEPKDEEPEEVVEEPKEEVAEEVKEEVPVEEKIAIDNTISDSLQKIGTQVSEISKKLEDFEKRLVSIEEEPKPSKVFSPAAVKKGDVMVSTDSEEVNKINIRLKELEDLKASDIKKYQNEKKWEEAFELLGKRDRIILGQ